MNDDWRDFAACKSSETTNFFPLVIKKKNFSQISSCFTLCESCPVSDHCLYNACINKEYGIWGRTTEKMRKIFLEERDSSKDLTLEECSALIHYLKDNKIYPNKNLLNIY
jgi:WhiB family redox-sensing transcriptional regulator